MAELTAYHEAGHAPMATLLGGRVERVTIDPDNDDGPARYGDTRIRWRKGLGDKEHAEKLVRVSLAGPVAEMIYTGDPYHPGMVAEWAADWRDAWNAAALLQPNERKRLDHLEQTSIQLYHRMRRDDLWAALAALADNLLAHETLETEEITEILDDWL